MKTFTVRQIDRANGGRAGKSVRSSTAVATAFAAGRQRGAAMIIALVVVAAVSLIAIGGMQDTNTQTNMVRNEQFYTNVYTLAMSEINAQIDALNLNDRDDPDPLVDTLLDQEVGDFVAQEMLGPDVANTPFDRDLMQATLCDVNDCLAPPGYSIGGGMRVLRVEINSVANFPGSMSRSDQTQGFWYLLPGAGGNIVSW